MDILLHNVNTAIKRLRPNDPTTQPITSFRRGDYLQLNFQSSGCRFNCSMCNYGQGVTFDTETTLQALKSVLKNVTSTNTRSILLGSRGSFLDSHEFPDELQDAVLSEISKTNIENIIIETHYSTMTERNLSRLKRFLPTQKIELELGLESVNDRIREQVLNKSIALNKITDVISLAHQHKMFVTLNFLFGIPFLSPAAQIVDTRMSINWAILNGADYMILSPLNIQPYTFFSWLYEKKLVHPASQWLFVLLLNQLTQTELEHLSITWYGDRSIQYSNKEKTIPPSACPQCSDTLQSFFDNFAQNKAYMDRKNALWDILNKPALCKCRSDAMRLAEGEVYFMEEDFQKAHVFMEQMVNKNGDF